MSPEGPEWEAHTTSATAPNWQTSGKDRGEGLAFPGGSPSARLSEVSLENYLQVCFSRPNSCKRGKELSINSQGSRVG